MVKACVNCKYFAPRRTHIELLDRCLHPRTVNYDVNYVTGEEKTTYPFCVSNRSGHCGKEGRLFVSAFAETEETVSKTQTKQWWEFWK